MTDILKPKWAVKYDSGPIVTKLSTGPKFEVLQDVVRAKPRPGEPLRFDIKVVAEPTSFQGKRAIVASPGPGWGNFEIRCDEGTPLGGDDSAPAPLGYLTAGVVFCLMTHISGYLRVKKLNLDRIKVEVRANFMTTMGNLATGGQASGACEGFETYVIVDSSEPPERVKELVEVCEEACMAMQALVNSVPATTKIILNGRAI